MMLRQVMLALAMVSIAATGFAAATATQPEATRNAPTLHVTHTYLRAAPGKRAEMIAYVQANWFAMDRIGIERGLFTDYALLERADSAEADWDVIVSVGYPTAQGHDAPGTADAFKAIRAAHREVKIEGLGQKELMTIVRHHPLTLVSQGK